MSAAPGCEFPNPCPVCGADDDHAERMKPALEAGSGATICPHPGERGHGTGCCCAGISRETAERRRAESLSSPPALTPDAVRQLLRECAAVVKPGEVLFFTCGDPNCTPRQIREIQAAADGWLQYNAPDVRVMVLPHGDMAVAETPA